MKSHNFLAVILAMALPIVLSAAVPKNHGAQTVDGDQYVGGGTIGFCSVPGASCNAKVVPVKGNGADETNINTSPQFIEAMGHLSHLFGWQIAGAAPNNDQLDSICNNIAETGHFKWAGEGLIPDNIKSPICQVKDANISPAAAVPHIIDFSTQFFITQLLNSFSPNDTGSLSSLCQLMAFVELGNFNLNSQGIMEAICAAANAPQKPLAFGAKQVPVNASHLYKNQASNLYAQMRASASVNDMQVNEMCAHANETVSSLNNILLDGPLISNILCSISAPLTTKEGANAIMTYSSSTFVVVMENLGLHDASYFLWMCKALNIAAMDQVGMDGAAVSSQICSHVSKAGNLQQRSG